MKKKIDVEYIANLARINLSAEDIKGFSGQLGDIISYIEKLICKTNSITCTNELSL